MQFKFGALCRCRGEEVGTLWGVTLEPRERLLLKVVIERPQADPLVRVKVPFASVTRADLHQVVLSISATQLARLPSLVHRKSDDPRLSRRKRRGDEVIESILNRHTKIHCRDGEVGSLRSIAIDERSGDIESLSLEIGVMAERVVTVKASQVEDIDEGRVNLGLSRDDLGELFEAHL